MIATVAESVFWASLIVVIYMYAIYPIVIWLCASMTRPMRPPELDEHELPSAALLVAAYNEEAIIENRIRNALQTEYPRNRLQIVIASDASSDRTAELVTAFDDRRVRLLDYPTRRGKAMVLNDSIPRLDSEIIVLSDANTEFRPDAIKRMARWFHEPQVGVVVGELLLRDPKVGKNVDHLYWKYESFLKRCESRLDAMQGAHGAIYAIRSNLFTPLPVPTSIDDIMIPLRAKLATGCRIIYEREAIAWEDTAPDLHGEFRRRCRNSAGGFQSLRILAPILNPRHGWLSFSFVSHKLLRWLSPFFLLSLLLSNLLLMSLPFYAGMLTAQIVFYAIAVAGSLVPFRGRYSKPIRLCTMFCVLNVAMMSGFIMWIWKGQRGVWRPTPRSTAS